MLTSCWNVYFITAHRICNSFTTCTKIIKALHAVLHNTKNFHIMTQIPSTFRWKFKKKYVLYALEPDITKKITGSTQLKAALKRPEILLSANGTCKIQLSQNHDIDWILLQNAQLCSITASICWFKLSISVQRTCFPYTAIFAHLKLLIMQQKYSTIF